MFGVFYGFSHTQSRFLHFHFWYRQVLLVSLSRSFLLFPSLWSMFSCTRSGSRTGLGGDKSKVEEIGASFHMNYGSPRGAPAAFDANGPSPEGSMRWTSTTAPTAPTAPAVCFQCGAPYRASGAATTQVGRWHSGLFEMASDLHNCVTTCFCPCVTFGQNVAALDRGKTTSSRQAAAIWCAFAFVGLSCFCSGFWRQSLRSKYNIPYAECGDYCLHFWCGPCALCQENRELKYRRLIPGASTQQAEPAARTIPHEPYSGMNR